MRRWRRSQRLSQSDFGQLLAPKVRHSTVCRWESGVRYPSLRFLRQIVALTGIPVHIALGFKDASQTATGQGRGTHGA